MLTRRRLGRVAQHVKDSRRIEPSPNPNRHFRFPYESFRVEHLASIAFVMNSTPNPNASMAVLHTAFQVAWADARLAPDEVSAARSVATVLGVIEQGRGLLQTPSEMRPEHRAHLDPVRDLAYATAVWMALADGVLDPSECRLLNRLRAELNLTAARAADIEDFVFGRRRSDLGWEDQYAQILSEFGAR